MANKNMLVKVKYKTKKAAIKRINILRGGLNYGE